LKIYLKIYELKTKMTESELSFSQF